MDKIKKGWVFYCNKCKGDIQREYDCKYNEFNNLVCKRCGGIPSYIGYPEKVKAELELLVKHLKKIEDKTGKDKTKEINFYNYLITRCSDFEERYREIKRV